MDIVRMETDRLILRAFEETDIEALYLLLNDKEVNIFLPWFPVKTLKETRDFFQDRFKAQKYTFAICMRENNDPIGYVRIEINDSYDFGYALRKEFWHKGIATEASKSLKVRYPDRWNPRQMVMILLRVRELGGSMNVGEPSNGRQCCSMEGINFLQKLSISQNTDIMSSSISLFSFDIDFIEFIIPQR